MALSEPGRYEVKNEEKKTHLVVHNLTETDSGLYYCSAIYPISSCTGHVELKVSRLCLFFFLNFIMVSQLKVCGNQGQIKAVRSVDWGCCVSFGQRLPAMTPETALESG